MPKPEELLNRFNSHLDRQVEDAKKISAAAGGDIDLPDEVAAELRRKARGADSLRQTFGEATAAFAKVFADKGITQPDIPWKKIIPRHVLGGLARGYKHDREEGQPETEKLSSPKKTRSTDKPKRISHVAEESQPQESSEPTTPLVYESKSPRQVKMGEVLLDVHPQRLLINDWNARVLGKPVEELTTVETDQFKSSAAQFKNRVNRIISPQVGHMVVRQQKIRGKAEHHWWINPPEQGIEFKFSAADKQHNEPLETIQTEDVESIPQQPTFSFKRIE